MIVLDTNVLSEFTNARPNALVLNWLDSQPGDSIWTTAITIFEQRLGVALLPAGKRRDQLWESLSTLVTRVLQNRILPFDEYAAEQAAVVAATRRRSGITA